MSRPLRSVPNQLSSDGGWAGMPDFRGSCGATSGANTAARTTITKKTSAILEEIGSARKRSPGAESRSARVRLIVTPS